MTLALAAPNAFGLAPPTFLRWFPGTVVRQVKLLLLPELKTVSVVSGVKQLALLTFSVFAFIWAQKQPAVWV
jgi:hypothetical protein